MSKTPRIVADFETQLSTAIAIGGTTFSISSTADDDSNTIPDGLYAVTVDNGATNKEYLLGSMVSGNFTAVQSISRQGVLTTGAARAHRIGASVIITDFTAIKIIADVLAGRDTLDGTAPLAYDTTPTLSDGKQLATVAYVLGVVTGGTVNFSSQTIAGVAGETVALPNVAYFKTADQRWWLSDADLTATCLGVKLGIVQSSAIAGGGISVQLSGIASGFTSLVAGTRYYLSNTAGGVSSSVGTTGVAIGWAISATQILLDFGTANTPSVDEKAAMAGGGAFGTPSSSNKFLTETKLTAIHKFGGTGADGALTIASGTTTLDLGSAAVFEKNYTTIAITGTGALAFSNPNTNGTVIILKSQGDVTLTSSATPMIDASGMGAAGAASHGSGVNYAGSSGSDAYGFSPFKANTGTTTTGGALPTASFDVAVIRQYSGVYPFAIPGAGGGSSTCASGTGAYTNGAGGRGGGALIIEVGGALNFTTASGISVAGKNGANATIDSAGNTGTGGAGGGAAGCCFIFYNTLTAASGTITITGGTGGNTGASAGSPVGGGGGASMRAAGNSGGAASNGAKSGGDGAAGFSLVAQNVAHF